MVAGAELEVLRAAEGGTGYWYGAATSESGFVRGRARVGGWISMGKGRDSELAHEVGHNLGLRHAPWGGALDVDPEFPYPNGSIGVSVRLPGRLPGVARVPPRHHGLLLRTGVAQRLLLREGDRLPEAG